MAVNLVSGFIRVSGTGKKKAPQAGLFDFILKPVEQQNALAPLRLTAKVKAKPKIVRIQVHLDFNYVANLWVKNLRCKGEAFFSVYFILTPMAVEGAARILAKRKNKLKLDSNRVMNSIRQFF